MNDESLPEIATKKINRFLNFWVKFFLIVFGLFVVVLGSFAVKYNLQQKAIAGLEKNGSAEYKEYVESVSNIKNEWSLKEDELKAENTSQKDIELVRKDYIELESRALLLKVRLDSSLSDIEKQGILKKMVELGFQNKKTFTSEISCLYTEEKLPLQDFFIGTTLKFNEPIIYVDWKQEQERHCSASFDVAKYYIMLPVTRWSEFSFDKESAGIKEYKIDPAVTFTVEGRFVLHKKDLFYTDSDYYILKASDGIISVVPSFVFENLSVNDNKTGPEIFKDGKSIGYIAWDAFSESVWLK